MERKRVEAIKKYITALYIILPFEKDFSKHGINAIYNGHPLLEHVNNFKKTAKISKDEFSVNSGLNISKPIISLIPGSRKQEIEKKLPIMLAASSSFLNNYNIVIAGMNNLKNIYQPYLENSEVSIIYDDTYNLLNNSKFALVTSGTATEAAFFNVPQVVVYKTSWISYKIAKFFC